MAYERSYTISKTKQPLGVINYGDKKIENVALWRTFAVIGEIAATLAFPAVAPAVAIGLAGATAQTTIDYLAGEGNAISTAINYGSSILPVFVGRGKAKQIIRYGATEEHPLIETQEVIARMNKASTEAKFTGAVGRYSGKRGSSGYNDYISQKLIRSFFGNQDVKKGWIIGTRRGVKKALLSSFSANPRASIKEIKVLLETHMKVALYFDDIWQSVIKNGLKLYPSGIISREEFIEAWQLLSKNIKYANPELQSVIEQQAMQITNMIRKGDKYINLNSEEFKNISAFLFIKEQSKLRIFEKMEKDLRNMLKTIKAIDAAGGIAGQTSKSALPEGKVISSEYIKKSQDILKTQSSKAERDFGSWTAEEVAEELGSGNIVRTKKGIAKWDKFHGEYTGSWRKKRVKVSRGEATSDEIALERARRAEQLNLLDEQKEAQLTSRYEIEKLNLRKTRPLAFFGTERGRFVTQAGQMVSGADVGRELVNAPSKLLLNGEFDLAGKVWFRWEKTNPFLRMKLYMRETKIGKLGRKLYGSTEQIELAARKHIIPFLYGSSWLLGVRAIKMDPSGHLNFLIIFHKDRRYAPIFITKVPKKRLMEFITAPSPGAYYHSPRGWALSANGQDIQGSGALLALAGIAAPSLNSLRNLLSLTSNTIGTTKNGFTTFFEDISHAVQKNWHARSARAVGIIAGGRVGGKFATALERSIVKQTTTSTGRIKTRIGFNSKLLVTAGVTTVRTGLVAKQGPHGRIKRRGKRYTQNALRRPIGQIQKALG